MTTSPPTPKERAVQLVRSLPDDSTFDEIIRELLMLRMMERGAADSDAGRVLSHDEMKTRVNQWLEFGGQGKRKTG